MSATMQEASVKSDIPLEGWGYRLRVKSPDYIFAYDVIVYENGRKVASGYARTRRGGRAAARKLKRRALERRTLVGESGPLR